MKMWIRKISAMTIILPMVVNWTHDSGSNGVAVGMNGESIIYGIYSEAAPEDSVSRDYYSKVEYFGKLPFNVKYQLFLYGKKEYAVIFDNDILLFVYGWNSGGRYDEKAGAPCVWNIDPGTAIRELRGRLVEADDGGCGFSSELERIIDMMDENDEPKLNFWVLFNNIDMVFYNVRPDDLQACLKSIGTFKLMNYDKIKRSK